MVVATTALLAQSLLRLEHVDAGFDVDASSWPRSPCHRHTSSDRARHLRLLVDLVARLEAVDGHRLGDARSTCSPFPASGWSVPAFTGRGAGRDARGRPIPSWISKPCTPATSRRSDVQIVRGPRVHAGDRDGASAGGDRQRGRRRRAPGRARTRSAGVSRWAAPTPTAPWLTVVGVARASRYRDLARQRPVLYVPAEQLIVAAQSLVVRTSAPLADAAAAVRAAVRDVDPVGARAWPCSRSTTCARPRWRGRASRRRSAARSALAALLLSALGVFAVTAASVQQRGGELRVRLALGATPAARPAAGARRRAAPGRGRHRRSASAGALAAARWLPDLLFEIRPSDPPSLAGAVALLCWSSLLACALPAWRAARMNPAWTRPGGRTDYGRSD